MLLAAFTRVTVSSAPSNVQISCQSRESSVNVIYDSRVILARTLLGVTTLEMLITTIEGLKDRPQTNNFL